MKLIVGLGNPTREYESTLHNLGFMVADAFLRVLGINSQKKECQGITTHLKSRDVYFACKNLLGDFACSEKDLDEKIIILKPQTYMNLSGDSIIEVMQKYKINARDVLVVYDDTDLGMGALRLRAKGSAGTHNGMKSIVYHLGEEFARLRIGAGKPPEYIPLKDYVLSRLNTEQLAMLKEPIERAVKILSLFAMGESIERLTALGIKT